MVENSNYSLIEKNIFDEYTFMKNVSKVIHSMVKKGGDDNNDGDLNIQFNNIGLNDNKMKEVKSYLNDIKIISDYSKIGNKKILLKIKKKSPFIETVKKLYEIL